MHKVDDTHPHRWDGVRHHPPNSGNTSSIRLVLVNQPACSTLSSSTAASQPSAASVQTYHFENLSTKLRTFFLTRS